MALIMHPPDSFPPLETSVMVIDSVSLIFTLAFPNTAQRSEFQKDPQKKNDPAQWAASRRWVVMGDLISRLGKLAAMRNIAVLLISQTTTKVRAGSETVLQQAISGNAWDNIINTRMVLFRDWLQRPSAASVPEDYIQGARLIGVTKAGGITYGGLGRIVPFTIQKVGFTVLCPLLYMG